MGSFQYITPFIYLLLVVIWSYILYFYARKIYKRSGVDKLLLDKDIPIIAQSAYAFAGDT